MKLSRGSDLEGYAGIKEISRKNNYYYFRRIILIYKKASENRLLFCLSFFLDLITKKLYN